MIFDERLCISPIIQRLSYSSLHIKFCWRTELESLLVRDI